MPAADRGEVWLVDLGLAAKVRPCVALSVPAGPRDRSLVTLVAHTTSRGSQFAAGVRATAAGSASLLQGAAAGQPRKAFFAGVR